MSGELPPALRAAVEALASEHPGRELAAASAALSADYRAGHGTRFSRPVELAAYAVTRMPATFAAARAALTEAAARTDFAPASLIDLGCGPGSAAWAAVEAFPTLSRAELVDSHAGMLTTGQRLAAGAPLALADAAWTSLAIDEALKRPTSADLVVASYAFNEFPAERLAACAAALARLSRGLVVIVEPGSRAGFAAVRALRDGLIAAGWSILAPCPGNGACPIRTPDWCHFSQRLPRLRAHRAAKGAEVPFEDEPYSYVAAAAPGIAVRPAAARVLRPPQARKPGTDFRLCTQSGITEEHVATRDRDRTRSTRKCGWGDEFPLSMTNG
ncbi:MAG: methyltransferase domain-containing protein [Phreatobacter sp.]|uniref:small ribosomal subunit Rsm22 family protein n=1 Tax=Phreatobacter sp. TaxID=1966341 RepID=UPI001A45EB24|nr:small ribosomal subunit Rsm22 family protein [Phreatobacter sp.]MBL8569649.1 methyltransferase domain-containing protein [Phreatobacter sp.]